MPFSTSNAPDKKTIVLDEDKQLSVSNDVTNPLRNSLLDFAVDIAELNYAESLDADSRDQIFVDPFVDSTRISSTNGVVVTTGQKGYATISDNLITDIEDVESGSTRLDWESNSGLSINSNSEMYGEYSLEGQGGSVDADRTFEEGLKSGDSFKISVKLQELPDYQHFQIALRDSAGESLFTLRGNSNYDLESSYSGNIIVSDAFSLNETIDFEFVPDLENETYDVYIDGTLEASDVPIQNSSWTPEKLDWLSIGSASGSQSFYIDEFTTNGKFGGGTTNSDTIQGTLTSISINKGFTPSAIQLDADIETDNDTSVSARLYDGNGNEVNISESEFGEQIDVPFSDSSFNAELELTTSNTSKKPNVNDYGIDIIK